MGVSTSECCQVSEKLGKDLSSLAWLADNGRTQRAPSSPVSSNILIIDDDRELADMLGELLRRENFAVTQCSDADSGLAAINAATPDLLVLDVMLPGRSGFDLLRELRRSHPGLPVLMLTARGDAVDRILGLELGADDYLAKPFDPRELSARVRAILRRAHGQPASGSGRDVLAIGALDIDLRRKRVMVRDDLIDLTGAEFRILACLAEARGQPIDRGRLTEQALGRKLALYDRSIDTHVSNLRRKLEKRAPCGVAIRAVRGAGYELLEDPQA